MKRRLGLAWLILGSLLMLIPILAFLKTSASNSKSRPAAPELARLGDRATVHAAGRGAPHINLADGREVLTAYDGDPALQQLLEQNLAQPLAMVSGDFDEDGVPDLISAYAGPSSGILTVHRGNVDAIYPNTTEANSRKAQGAFTDAPFLSPARLLGLPVSPDFIGAGDFDADGHPDLAAAARGGHSLYLLAGNGNGGFGSPESIELPGAITAMATGEINRRDGLADIIVGITTPTGPQVLVFQNARGALRAAPEPFALTDVASDFAIGQFDGDALPDLAVAAGHDLMVVYGRDREASPNAATPEAPRAITSRQSFPFTLKSLASGDFTGKPQAGLAALSGDGGAYLLSASFNKKGDAEQAKKSLRWKTQLLTQGTWPASARLLKARVSNMPKDDLLVVDSSNRQLHIIETGNSEPTGRQAISSSGGRGTLIDLEVEDEPVAALPMRLNADAINDVVILRKHNIAPSAVTTQAVMTFTVTNNANSGMGSLRQAIIDANTNPGADTINFSVILPPQPFAVSSAPQTINSGPLTIDLISPLPTITEAVTIDGTTQPGFGGSPIIELNGSGVPAGGSGLTIVAGNCAVRALIINRFADNLGSGGNGIIIQTGGNNVLEDNFVGTNDAGSTALGNFIGVTISNSPANTVGGLLTTSRNLISGNINDGVLIINSLAINNQIRGNFIGTDAAGTADLGNGNEGVRLEGVANNTVGGTTVSARNVISGNSDQGILIRISATANLVQGNFIGTNATGTAAIANAQGGIFVQDSTNNTVGGTAAGAGNLLSGNVADGILIAAGSGNIAQGNLIGTNAAGTAAIANGRGVRISSSTGNTIGGTAAGARNVISGNGGGISLESGASNNNIQGNFIGTDVTGNADLGNTFAPGVSIANSSNNTIGGTTAAARNIISGNDGVGVFLIGTATGNQIQGNFIGTNAAGTASLGSGLSGVQLEGVANNTIGGTIAGARNVISGNSDQGILVRLGSTGNLVQGNFIGTDSAGTAAIGNNNSGIFVTDSPNNTLGGTAAGAGNLVSGSGFSGIDIGGASSTGNLVQGNLIGTNAAGTAAIANGGFGVRIDSSAGNTIGGTAAGARNVISGNAAGGVGLVGGANNNIQGNFIGTDVTGTAAIPNNTGVSISSSANNTIGGTAVGAGNVISGNVNDGLLIFGGSANTTQGNFIGTNAAGIAAIPNGRGVRIDSSTGNTIGGTAAGARNIISGNNDVGVSLNAATNNQIQGNFIGADITGTAALGNFRGVTLDNSSGNLIGGATAAARNIISGNDTNALSLGIAIAGAGSTGNLVQGNFIGTNSTGLVALPNPGGVLINDAPGNTIGGTAAGAGNLISGNTGAGIVIQFNGATNNAVQGNLIGTNPTGTAALGNFQGVAIIDAPGNTIGGTAAGARNIISANNNVGLVITNPGSTNNLVQGNFIGTDVTGSVALGNAIEGIGIGNAANNTIGGTTAAARNIISGNGESGIEILSTATNNLVQGNFIGTNVNGTGDLGNTNSGVRIADSSNNTIGGTSAGARNIISGNGHDGVFIENTSPGTGSANLIQGNFIGTDVTGTVDLGNDMDGIGIVDVPGNIIGGASAGARNIISGNNGNGINISGMDATGNHVQGNSIGTNAGGGAALANNQNGLLLSGGPSNNTIGGIGAGNIIAFNGAAGLLIEDFSIGNAVLSNSILSNGGLGIAFGGLAQIPLNDACDGDLGANNLQNFPVLTSATSNPGNTTIAGTLNSTLATTFRIEFFSNAGCDPSGNGEGQTFIGATTIAPAGVCDSPFNVTLPVTVAVGNVITATATDSSNNTSEFSACVAVVAGMGACTLSCPPNLIASLPNSASCAAVVNYAPTTSGACGAVSCEPPSGSLFAVGGTKVTCTIPIPGSASQVCSFTVTVLDPFAPIVACPANISRPATPGQASTVVNYPAPTVTDNCSTPTVQCAPPSGTGFPVGTTTVRCTATDSSGNRGNCSFDITVLDSEAPVIKCPANVSAAPPSGQSSAVVSYPPPTVTDNLPGATVVCSPASGSSFPLGTTTVTCTATDSGGNKASCSFVVGVGGPEVKVTIPGNKTALEFATVPPARKAPKPKNNPCSSFTLQNIGFGPLVLTLDSISRTGTDVDNRRITDPNDARFFSVSLVNADQSLTPFDIGGMLTLQTGQTQILCAKFDALIPAPAGKTTGLSASDVLPDVLTSKLTFRQNAGANFAIPILARVATGLVLIDPVNPRRPPVVTFTRSGNDLIVSFAVLDSNLDVSRAKYEFLDANGQVVAGPFEVDLTEPLRSLSLVKGQSFTVEQRFTGASANSAITGVRVTVFDGATSTVGASSTASAGPPGTSSIQLRRLTQGVTLYPPDIRLGPRLP